MKIVRYLILIRLNNSLIKSWLARNSSKQWFIPVTVPMLPLLFDGNVPSGTDKRWNILIRSRKKYLYTRIKKHSDLYIYMYVYTSYLYLYLYYSIIYTYIYIYNIMYIHWNWNIYTVYIHLHAYVHDCWWTWNRLWNRKVRQLWLSPQAHRPGTDRMATLAGPGEGKHAHGI